MSKERRFRDNVRYKSALKFYSSIGRKEIPGDG
jgi:hypothetical protein